MAYLLFFLSFGSAWTKSCFKWPTECLFIIFTKPKKSSFLTELSLIERVYYLRRAAVTEMKHLSERSFSADKKARLGHHQNLLIEAHIHTLIPTHTHTTVKRRTAQSLLRSLTNPSRVKPRSEPCAASGYSEVSGGEEKASAAIELFLRKAISERGWVRTSARSFVSTDVVRFATGHHQFVQQRTECECVFYLFIPPRVQIKRTSS